MAKHMRALLALLFCSAPSLVAQTSFRTDSLVEAGFRQLAAYEQTQRLADARNAHRAFSEVLRQNPHHARAHLGLGLAYAAVERQQLDPLGFNDATRVTNNTLAVRHLVEALKGDADAGSAARGLVAVTRREYDVDRFRASIAALENVGSPDEAVSAALGELHIALYAPERAEAIARSATTPQARRVLGIAQLLQGQSEAGGRNYLAALAAADSIALTEFVRDARWLADPIEADAWKALGVPGLRQRLQQLWERRALRSGISTAERLATHFARVQRAVHEFSYYRQRVAVGPAKSVDLRMDGTEFDVDDRAFVYVRYGEPEERIRTIVGNVAAEDTVPRGQPQRAANYQRNQPFPTNESWVYRRLADHPLSFDFFLIDARGWTLTYDVVRCSGSTLPYSDYYLRDRLAVDPRYGLLLAECQQGGALGRAFDPVTVANIAAPFIKERDQLLSKAVVRDNSVPRTVKNVPLLADVLQFAGNAKQTSVTAVVMWPLNAVAGKSDADGDFFASKLSLVIADTLTGLVTRKDTTISFRRPPGSPASEARVYLTVNATPTENAFYRLTIRDLNADSVVTMIGDSIDVRQLSADRLTLSDIALVSDAEKGSWVRADRRLSLLPSGAALRDFSVYYEAYGLTPGAKYQTEISFEPEEEGLARLLAKLQGNRVVALKFEGEATAATVRELQAIRSELPRGKYTLRISLTSNGVTAAESRKLRLP